MLSQAFIQKWIRPSIIYKMLMGYLFFISSSVALNGYFLLLLRESYRASSLVAENSLPVSNQVHQLKQIVENERQYKFIHIYQSDLLQGLLKPGKPSAMDLSTKIHPGKKVTREWTPRIPSSVMINWEKNFDSFQQLFVLTLTNIRNLLRPGEFEVPSFTKSSTFQLARILGWHPSSPLPDSIYINDKNLEELVNTIEKSHRDYSDLFSNQLSLLSRQKVFHDVELNLEQEDRLYRVIIEQIDRLIQNSEKKIKWGVDQLGLLREASERVAWGFTALNLVFVLGLTLILTISISKPIRRLNNLATQISNGNFNQRIEKTGGDEIGQLTRTFNLMAVKLKELDRLKSEFLSNVTHDLKGPLSSILQSGNLLFEINEDERLKPYLEIIKKNCWTLEQLINDLLELRQFDFKGIELDLQPVECIRFIKRLSREIFPLVKEKNIKLFHKLPKTDIIMNVDEKRMKEVFTNLIINAIQYTPDKGKITIGAVQHEKEVRFWVSDSGTGIPPELHKSIFERFHRGSEKDVPGTGLGLAISKTIVEAHGGTIGLDSEEGKGSTFWFTVKVATESELNGD